MIHNSIKNKFLGGLLVLTYLFSLCFVVLHNHSHDHSHNHNSKKEDLSYCQADNYLSDLHINCSHDSHVDALDKTCFICDNCIVVDHLSSDNFLNSINYKSADNYNELLQNVVVKDFTNYLNKSPPSLI